MKQIAEGVEGASCANIPERTVPGRKALSGDCVPHVSRRAVAQVADAA